MSEDREQEAREEQADAAARPVTAAARRERRASARPAGRKPRATRVTDSDGGKSPVDTKTAEDKKGRPTPSRDRKEGPGSPLKRFTRFLREVVAELRKVVWPTQKQLLTYTFVVLVFVSVMIALVFGLDAGFSKGVFWLFG